MSVSQVLSAVGSSDFRTAVLNGPTAPWKVTFTLPLPPPPPAPVAPAAPEVPALPVPDEPPDPPNDCGIQVPSVCWLIVKRGVVSVLSCANKRSVPTAGTPGSASTGTTQENLSASPV